MDSTIKEAVLTVASGSILMLFGSSSTAILWIARAIFKAKKDLDFAHEKIRCMEARFSNLEKEIKDGNDYRDIG